MQTFLPYKCFKESFKGSTKIDSKNLLYFSYRSFEKKRFVPDVDLSKLNNCKELLHNVPEIRVTPKQTKFSDVFQQDDIKKIASEALELHRKIASDNKRLLDLKKQISEASVGRNSSYKIPLDKGTVRINKVKESLSYSFDQEGFNKLDNQIKDKFK